VHYEFQRLVLDVAERGFAQIADHVRRHAPDARDVSRLVLPGAQELGVLRSHSDLLPFHALLEHRGLVGVASAGIACGPGFAQARRRLNGEFARVLEHPAELGAIRKQPRPVLLGREREADRLTVQPDRRETGEPVVGETSHVQDLVLEQDPPGSVQGPVFMGDGAIRRPEGRHPIRVQRDELGDGAPWRRHDLSIGVSAQRQVRHEHLEKLEARLPAVRLIVQ